MVFLLCDNDEYVNVKQITFIHPSQNNFEHSVIHTSDGREHLFRRETKQLIDVIKEKV